MLIVLSEMPVDVVLIQTFEILVQFKIDLPVSFLDFRMQHSVFYIQTRDCHVVVNHACHAFCSV